MRRRRNTRRRNRFNSTYVILAAAVLILGVGAVVLFSQKPLEAVANKRMEKQVEAYQIYLNDRPIGAVEDTTAVADWMMQVRKEIASGSEEIVFLEADLECRPVNLAFGDLCDEEEVKAQMRALLKEDVIETMQRAYTVKVNEYMANLSSEADVKKLLEAAIGKYDEKGKFAIELVQDEKREFNVLQAQVVEADGEEGMDLFPNAGVSEQIEQMMKACEVEVEKDFEDYELGLMSMYFPEDIEIVEAYLPVSQLIPVEQAIQELTVEQEQQVIYEVQSGDTLSEIAITMDIPMEDIVAMNDSLESVNSTLQIGQELIITVPEPELSVERKEVNYYEEIYDAEIVYIDVDDWYTYEKEVVQQPSAGFRKVVVEETYVNNEMVSREIVKEEVVMEAVEKIVKRGTKIPPTYIKPLSGGRTTSKFGPRKAPKKGASTYHKGHDWATPTGTPIYASCGGTIKKAGWGSGYGYVVYIDHTDGRQTRYAHLSKVLVKAGQKVKQGEKIALSGNTGVSTGPHLHFELLIDGKQVNPIPYLD